MPFPKRIVITKFRVPWKIFIRRQVFLGMIILKTMSIYVLKKCSQKSIPDSSAGSLKKHFNSKIFLKLLF